MKNKGILIFCIITLFAAGYYLFSKFSIDFSEYEKFIDNFYDNVKNNSFNSIANSLYDDRACVRVLISNHRDSKISTKQIMVSKLFDSEEIEEVDKFLNTLGKFTEKTLINKSVENIYDVSVQDLFCLNYKIKYDNYETYEQFWLKQVGNRILIYRYTICLENYEK